MKKIMVLAWVLVLSLPGLSTAAWQENGIPMYNGTFYSTQRMISDGNGGMYLLVVEQVSTAISATRFDRNGEIIWQTSIPAYPNIASLEYADAVSDGAGGVVFCYSGAVIGVYSTIYNRILPDGSTPLGSGVQVNSSPTARNPQLLCDGTYVYFTWQDNGGGQYIYYCQKTDLNGAPQWAAGDVPLESDPGYSSRMKMLLDGAGGLMVAWTDSRNGNSDIFAQRIDASGTKLWGADGLAVCTDLSSQYLNGIVPDGRGGLVAQWLDYRDGTGAVWVQRIKSYGSPAWAANGLMVANGIYTAQMECLASGVVLMAWVKVNGSTADIVTQALGPDGTLILGPTGRVSISGINITSSYSALSASGETMLYAWTGISYGEGDIYLQRFDQAGNPLISPDRTAVCTAPDDQNSPMVLNDGDDGCFLAWTDYRGGVFSMYGQHMTKDGYWGEPAAYLAGVTDVPDDQGGFVNLSWDASRLDTYPSGEMSAYSLWRSIPPAKALASPSLITRPADRRSVKTGPVILASGTADKALYWEFIDSVAPHGFAGYGSVQTTPYDSLSPSTPSIDYMVITETSVDSVFFMSNSVTALSVDNLAPGAVKGLRGAASYGPSSIDLAWHPNPENDLDHYNLYRGTDAGFTPDQTSLVAAVADTTFLDNQGDGSSYYRLTAVDIHGNEGPDVLLSPDGVSSVGDSAPAALAIEGIAPNPFNPMTTIAFNVRRTGTVRLEIYDVAGRRVRVLVDQVLSAGPARAVWRGLDDSGQQVASGTYFARLSDDLGVVTRSLVLIK